MVQPSYGMVRRDAPNGRSFYWETQVNRKSNDIDALNSASTWRWVSRLGDLIMLNVPEGSIAGDAMR